MLDSLCLHRYHTIHHLFPPVEVSAYVCNNYYILKREFELVKNVIALHPMSSVFFLVAYPDSLGTRLRGLWLYLLVYLWL